MHTDRTAKIGDWVRFRISEVFLPEPSEVLAKLTPDVEANGVIEDFSDSGQSRRAYAVVRITTEQSVLVSVNALRILNCE